VNDQKSLFQVELRTPTFFCPMAEFLLAFKAGRSFRREGTQFVDASPTKGAIILASSDDGLLHFIWKNRATDGLEEDLILFPSDATFTKVADAPSSRTYVLQFSSSNQRHFFWMQDADTSRDDEFAENVNKLLQDPEAHLEWNTDAPDTTTQPQASTSNQGATSSNGVGSVSNPPTADQLSQIQQLIASIGGTAPRQPDLSLADILTPSHLNPLFTNHPELIPALFPHLPPDLPVPPSTEVLQRTINSPQFRAAVHNLDEALRTGLLGGLVRGLGLSEEAGTGIQPFLRAIEEQANQEVDGATDDGMETD